eukprot:TRINITY_DN73864_c0_g1_i1.p1 TRINITY_DN73864_c0_g1~~TRINITY_DN73864_c0_g1_i1.p1  ORF type:complete len:226 (+),score=18.38 TRINITY_DN73864_c0_g1_i1:60-737(+)
MISCRSCPTLRTAAGSALAQSHTSFVRNSGWEVIPKGHRHLEKRRPDLLGVGRLLEAPVEEIARACASSTQPRLQSGLKELWTECSPHSSVRDLYDNYAADPLSAVGGLTTGLKRTRHKRGVTGYDAARGGNRSSSERSGGTGVGKRPSTPEDDEGFLAEYVGRQRDIEQLIQQKADRQFLPSNTSVSRASWTTTAAQPVGPSSGKYGQQRSSCGSCPRAGMVRQ